MRSISIGCLVIALFPAWAWAQPSAEEAQMNAIFAIVDDQVITRREVIYAILPAMETLYTQYGSQKAVLEKKLFEIQKRKVEDLVARYLIIKDFTNAGYNLPESFLEDRVQERIRQDFYGDRAKMTKTLKEDGVTKEKYRRNIRDQIIISFLRDKHVSQGLIISPQKINNYYQTNQAQYQMEDQVKLRMIAINRNKESPETAKKMADEILAKLVAGTPFDEMAALYSDGSKRFTAGDWVERKGLREEIGRVAFALKAGQHSAVIETPDTCYIILVEDSLKAHIKPLAEVREEIEKELLLAEQDRLYNQWIDRLKNKAFVRYFF